MSEQAENLTKFLVQADGYNRKSPLVQRVETEIMAMTTKIAAEIVAEHPTLAETIRTKTRDAINRALLDDSHLNRLVTEAVSKVITRRALDDDD